MRSPVGTSPAIATLPGPTSSRSGDGLLARLAVTAPGKRFPLVISTHLVLIILSSYLALWLRFDGVIPAALIAVYFQLLPWMLAIRLVTFLPFGLYGGLWRYTGVWDLSRIVLAVLTSSAAIYLLLHRELGPAIVPRSIVIIDSLLLVSFLGGVRLLWRIVPQVIRASEGRRVLILGAGDAGEMIVREMRKSAAYAPVGFIDHDPSKVGRTIHGLKVLGTHEALRRVVKSTKATEVLVAIPSADAATIRELVRLLEPFKLPITTLPSLRELLNGKVGIAHIRPLAIEDLLPRSPIVLSPDDARQLVGGKRVLVTGAGGSIGSELCRQIAQLAPANLILFERYENGLYTIANDLVDGANGVAVHSVIGDVTDDRRVDAVFSEYHPEIVFHAAAHKHVPLMESNPCEAVKNNVVGTRTVAEAALRHRTERFVLISTDKAVNPSSVMGASKRVAELIVRAIASRGGDTRFITVRFGNVLGSNGSVVPKMLEQIRAGGPVTVTHPDIRRYFMLIPEAVQLVLQSAVLAQEPETFVLDMGEQIRVLDVARNLIRLSGFVPDDEIPIAFVGLRPGEKLAEELVGDGEELEPTGTSKILRVRGAEEPEPHVLNHQVEALVEVAALGRVPEVVDSLRQIIPSFNPEPMQTTENGDRGLKPAFSERRVSPSSPSRERRSPGRLAAAPQMTFQAAKD